MADAPITERVNSLLAQFYKANRFFADVLYVGKLEKEELENTVSDSTSVTNFAESLIREYKMSVFEVEEISYLWCGSKYLQSNTISSLK